MLISYKNNFIFIHNHKVAGTSITKSLRNNGLVDPFFKNNNINKFIETYFILQKINNSKILRKILRKIKLIKKINLHHNAIIIKEKISKKRWENSFKFDFVRNPWDWQVSLYHFMLQTKTHHQHNLIKSMKSFDEYIEWRVKKDKHLQKEFFYDENGNCLVDFIGKFENLEKDFQKICHKLGIKAQLSHLNKSKRKKDYRKYYNLYTKNLITKHFKEDIKTINYKF
jgi:hypothetical protein